jgi:hypothetical protein
MRPSNKECDVRFWHIADIKLCPLNSAIGGKADMPELHTLVSLGKLSVIRERREQGTWLRAGSFCYGAFT